MFRQMRRFKQQISLEECREVLRRATSGVLGLYGDDGYPYTVPISFVYEEGGDGLGTIGFHCARTGHKIDAIRRDEKVSFTVIDRDEVVPEARTTKFCSVIAFGRARILEDEDELRRAAMAVGSKYCKGYEQGCAEETEDTIRRGTLCCVEITIDHMTGKIARELLVERRRGEAAE
ncbi:MAG: 5-nitroimidazole antibiotic resistance protein [Clostridiales bacterium]|nr:5-nitroimidazole antibiotic resistance protein [Clostridiales bacterium]